jgi:hypothetical protein
MNSYSVQVSGCPAAAGVMALTPAGAILIYSRLYGVHNGDPTKYNVV